MDEIKRVILAGLALLIVGCACRDSTIPPVPSSALDYDAMECEDATVLLEQKIKHMDALAHRQKNHPTLSDADGEFQSFGAGVDGELAQVKGEVFALRRSISKNCKKH